MMTLTDRFNCFKRMAHNLQSTTSIVEKRMIVNCMPNEMKDDVEYVFEVLAGYHKFGFTYDVMYGIDEELPVHMQNWTMRQYLEQLNYCNEREDWSNSAVAYATKMCAWFYDVVGPIVNRTLRLGIGKSVLPKNGLSAMLGKKYEGGLFGLGNYYVTEKLDGNRCIAMYDGTKWVFTSRNGKPMKVYFDMRGLPTEYIYDGEVMSDAQTKSSFKLYNILRKGDISGDMSKAYVDNSAFNVTSGLINSKYDDKSNLVYNIFDIVIDGVPYKDRRELLNVIKGTCTEQGNWTIVPVLMYGSSDKLNNDVHSLLDCVANLGAEGLMINDANAVYEHKRTNGLLKYKKVQTMDMVVTGITEGTGKYAGLVGALECAATFDDGTVVECQIGSGLSDDQRWLWACNQNIIIGKIVEVAYFSKSQSKGTNGTIYYSLRFPRLKRVRTDKIEVSKY